MRRLMAGVGIGAVIALGVAGVSSTASRPVLAVANGLELTPTMGWNDWNGNGCDNDAADVEANAEFVHESGLQADGYEYIVNDGCWNDMVGVDQPYYTTGYNYSTGTDTQATPAQPDPGGGTEATLPTPGNPSPTAEEAACGVGVNGRGTGVTGSLGSVPEGQLFVNPYLFPPSSPCANDGMKIVATYVHSLGLKFGLWLDASDDWNGEEIDGSYGFDQEDASTFASWGVDFIKADWSGNAKAPTNDPLPYGSSSSPGSFDSQCGYVSGAYPYTGSLEPCGGSYPVLTHEQLAQLMYGALSVAVQNTGQPMVLNLCVHDSSALVQQWGASIGNSWKSDLNISPTFSSLVSMANDVDQYAQYAGPDGYNDPDMLEVGNGMSQVEDESEFSLWAELAAPLIMGANLAPSSGVVAAEQRTNVDQFAPPTTATQDAYLLSIFANKDVIAVDQDPLGKQAEIVSFDGTRLVLAKSLTNGDIAVTLFNEGSTPALISTTATAVGMPTSPLYTLKDLWSKDITETAGAISAFVQPHATVMYQVSIPRPLLFGLADQPNVTLSVAAGSPVISPDTQTSATVSLVNNAVTPILLTTVALQAPSGWTVAGRLDHPELLLSGKSASVTFGVTPGGANAPISSATLAGLAGFIGVRGPETPEVSLSVPLVSPVQAPYQTADTTSGPPALFGELGSALAIDAAGTGVTTPGYRGASDQYGAIYVPSGADITATSTVQVVALSGGRGPEAGLMMRNTISGSAPEGVVLYVNGAGQVVMAWDASGGSTVDHSASAPGAPGAGVWLELQRTGTDTYTGAYATSAGGPWTVVKSVTIAASGAAASQDVGVFAASGAAGSPSEADFAGFAVSG